MSNFSKMSLIKSFASYCRQNLHLAGLNRSQSKEIKAHLSGGIASLLHAQSKPKMGITNARDDSNPPSPPPPRFPFYIWAKWILGTALTIILPFWRQKWRSLLKLEGEVEMVAGAVDNVAKVVEEVAMVTEKMAEDAAESLPEDDHKLKDALVCIENVSKKVVEEAHLTQDIIHKVDDLKEEVETLIDPIKEREKRQERHEK
ncbi:uncharacterized protein A4U43_C03F18680 [Asparagus officinalis]|uniref:Uncharacterized protein n=1 Tax=Asparagus officinalis TaxID=4686 RepID=A0A5P1FB69_ASPOF|nr:uncharacterized protein LOC109832257 [Asparagus officinalis]ONK75608.1 uncharacterized protein A4U43_C03F18680 [Asparagus officinalis]